ncbi:WD40 repeat domain-containing protein [Spongiactinospora rosea]|uniref:hypothetical protein n=1 Tax=Spongiactinospora rosea TaxID=2248750 RepID=UPI0011C05BD1|nr:hypothetical protein [Spongiactinospora rosea]
MHGRYKRPRVRGGPSALAFRPDGKELAVGGGSGRVQLWDVTDPHRPIWRAETPAANLTDITLLPYDSGGRTLYLADNAYVVRWDTGSATVPMTMGTVFRQYVWRIAVSRSSATMARVAPRAGPLDRTRVPSRAAGSMRTPGRRSCRR